jgi:hypothetical protein
VQIDPGLAIIQHEMGYLNLYRGEYEEGWRRFELRLDLFPDLSFYNKQFGLDRLWRRGQDLNGRSLLIYSEQGMGDTIQFVRYVPHIKKQFPDCKVSFLAYHCLGGLLQSFHLNVDNLVLFNPGDPAEVPLFDCYASLMSLPYLLNISQPIAPIPYNIESRVFPDPDAFNIIIHYSGNPTHENDSWRSVPLKYFSGIASIPGVKLHTLVQDYPKRRWGDQEVDLLEGVNFEVNDLSPNIKSYKDSAEYIKGANLVISVDTSVLHLAGTVGTETWAVLPCYGEWRWGCQPNQTVFYPSIKLFRQNKDLNWNMLFERIETEIKKRLELPI